MQGIGGLRLHRAGSAASRPSALCTAIAIMFASAPSFADAWFVTPMHGNSVGIAYAPPNSTGSNESHPSLEQALAAVSPDRQVSGINLGYILNGDLLGMQEAIRSLMASSYPDEYAALLRSRSIPGAWRGKPLLAKLHATILRSSTLAEMKPALAKNCLEVGGLHLEKQNVVLRAGVPHFTAFAWLELKRCEQ
jgi:hypothetical protein